jgi:hypothetical protein
VRINLITPFTEKDAAKALGARWDANRKNWYIENVEDLTPFLRWIPESAGIHETPLKLSSSSYESKSITEAHTTRPPELIAGIGTLHHCGCAVLPWEDCEHTLKTFTNASFGPKTEV